MIQWNTVRRMKSANKIKTSAFAESRVQLLTSVRSSRNSNFAICRDQTLNSEQQVQTRRPKDFSRNQSGLLDSDYNTRNHHKCDIAQVVSFGGQIKKSWITGRFVLQT